MKNYWKPTPKKWRMIGDALLATATFLVAGGLFSFDSLKEIFSEKTIKFVIGFALVIGVLGKFLTNLFKVDDKPDNTDQVDKP